MSTLLQVRGLVRHAREFTREELRTLPRQVPDVGTRVKGRAGEAVVLAAILEAVVPEEAARFVTLVAEGGQFSASVPLEAVTGALVIHSLDGEPLPADKGGPIRFLIPEAPRCGVEAAIDACANIKYLERIELVAEAGRDTRPSSLEERRARHKSHGA